LGLRKFAFCFALPFLLFVSRRALFWLKVFLFWAFTVSEDYGMCDSVLITFEKTEEVTSSKQDYNLGLSRKGMFRGWLQVKHSLALWSYCTGDEPD
jgi:hypothetical protein